MDDVRITRFTMEELNKIANYIVLHGRYWRHPGLFHGKTGLMLAMFLYARKSSLSVFREFAEDLLDDIQNQLNETLPQGMENGLSGIAYAMAYLSNHGHLCFDQNEILCDIDSKIMSVDPRRITDYGFETGALGVWAYVCERLNSRQSVTSLDKQYIAELGSVLKKNHTSIPGHFSLIEKLHKPEFPVQDYLNNKLDLDGGSAYYLLQYSLQP